MAENKTDFLRVRFTPDQLAAIKSLAARDQSSVSEWLRSLVIRRLVTERTAPMVVVMCCGQPMIRIRDEDGHPTQHLMCGPCGKTAAEHLGTVWVDRPALGGEPA